MSHSGFLTYMIKTRVEEVEEWHSGSSAEIVGNTVLWAQSLVIAPAEGENVPEPCSRLYPRETWSGDLAEGLLLNLEKESGGRSQGEEGQKKEEAMGSDNSERGKEDCSVGDAKGGERGIRGPGVTRKDSEVAREVGKIVENGKRADDRAGSPVGGRKPENGNVETKRGQERHSKGQGVRRRG